MKRTIIGGGVWREASIVQQQVPHGDGSFTAAGERWSQQPGVTDSHVCNRESIGARQLAHAYTQCVQLAKTEQY